MSNLSAFPLDIYEKKKSNPLNCVLQLIFVCRKFFAIAMFVSPIIISPTSDHNRNCDTQSNTSDSSYSSGRAQ
jgi:hypothetical protein